MNLKHSREDIIDGGVTLLRIAGYEGTGIQDILSKMNISKGTFYNYFSSKEDYVFEVVDSYGEEGLLRLHQKLTNPRLTPMKRVKKHLIEVRNSFVEDDFEKSCLLDVMAMDAANINERIASKVNRLFERRKAIFAACIKEGQQIGEIRNDLKASELAEFVLSGYSGAELRAKTGKTAQPLNSFIKMVLAFFQS